MIGSGRGRSNRQTAMDIITFTTITRGVPSPEVISLKATLQLQFNPKRTNLSLKFRHG